MIELIEVLDEHIWVMLLGGIFIASIVTTVMKGVTAMFTTACRERTRREIAAYIAEGSLTADQGERLVRADVNKGGVAAM